MSDFKHKDMMGSIFPDDSERKKDYNGSCVINGVEYWISGWRKEGSRGPWLSLAFEPKQQFRQDRVETAPEPGRNYRRDF